MKSLTFKLICICGMGVLLTWAAISVTSAFSNLMPVPVPGIINLLAIASMFTYLVFVLRHLILKRISKLSAATKEVTDGNFDVAIPNKGRDQISRLTNNFNKMTQDLKANQHINKEFSRNFSHEMKTPLASIMGFAESIANSTNDERIVREANIIIDEAKRLSDLSQAVLQLAQLDGTSIIAQNDKFSPSSQIRNILVSMQQHWESKELEFNIESDEVLIVSNESLIYQVWKNLISNAIKYSNKKTQININLTVVGTKLKFNISNAGSPIKEEDKNKIFSLFFVADESRTRKDSTGVGLTLTKTIVEKLGGSISFTSSNDGLTVFNVELEIKSNNSH